MIPNWLRSKWLWGSTIVFVGSFSCFFSSPFGGPTTPMTLERADRLFKEVSGTGQRREEVQAWLSSRSILGDLLTRDDTTKFKGWWMDVFGKQTVAECAGLNVDDVYSVVRVDYPDASRHLMGQIKITVYFFFDNNERLLRRWANEFDIGL